MESSSFLQDLNIVSPIVTSALAVFLFAEGARRKSSKYLAYCILVISTILWSRYLFFSRSVLVLPLPFVVFPAIWFPGPLFRRHLLPGADEHQNHRWFLMPSILAALSLVVHSVFLFYTPELQSTRAILEHQGFVSTYTSAYVILAVLFNLFHFGTGIRNVRVAPDSKRGSSLTGLMALAWTLVLYMLTHLMLVICTLFGWLQHPFHPVEALASLALAYTFVHVSLKYNPQALHPSAKYSKQSINPEEVKNHLETLRAHMEREKPFLEEGITLQELARQTDIPAHHLSIVINTELSMNFFSFINEYRIAEAKRLLQDPAYSDYTLLRIAYEAGFQSKAGFNKAFKRQTGRAPGEFRKRSPEIRE